MPAGVRKPQRIVQRIRVAVEGLGRGRVGDDGVRLGEAAEQRIVPAGAVTSPAGGGGREGAAPTPPRDTARCSAWLSRC